jgi:regulator of protease activity HflC (stomatin/prohibitin superfamily)
MIWIAAAVLIIGIATLFVRAGNRAIPAAAPVGIILTAIALAIASSITTVPAGHVGVKTLFGAVQEPELPEGIHLINPLAAVERMSVRSETIEMVGAQQITALSSDGLRMGVDVTVVYRLVGADAPWTLQNVGRDYAVKIVQPAARTAVREAMTQFNSQEAYSDKRELLADETQKRLVGRIAALLAEREYDGQAVAVQQVLLRDVKLPTQIRASIEQKLAAEQDAQRMVFVLQKETQEAQRKRIEATGIKDFQDIVRKGIDEQLLRWKGIEATERLAESQNTKIVVIGGTDGLPIILNSEK